MVKYQRWVIVVVAISLTRAAHHIVRVTILAVLGLAGLYMLHTLAQDFQKIYQQIQNGQGPGRAILNTIASNPIYKNIRNNVGKTIADTIASGSPYPYRASHRSDDVRHNLCAGGLTEFCTVDNYNFDLKTDSGAFLTQPKEFERYLAGQQFNGYKSGVSSSKTSSNFPGFTYKTESGGFSQKSTFPITKSIDEWKFPIKTEDLKFSSAKSEPSGFSAKVKDRKLSSRNSEPAGFSKKTGFSVKPSDDWGFNSDVSSGLAGGYFIVKREISPANSKSAITEPSTTFNYPEINWERVLNRDPASCARSLVCQLAATPIKELEFDEESILYIVRIATKKDDWASKELRDALQLGETVGSPKHCEKNYILCPYSGRTMMKILRFFGGSKS